MASQGNFTGLLNQTDDEDPRCSVKLAGGINSQLIGLSVGNIFLSITTFCGNALILAALHKVSRLYPSSKLFYRNLAISDFLTGIVVEPVRVTYWISAVKQQWTICRYLLVASQSLILILFSVSLLTMTAISIDRLLFLLLGIRYRQIVTLKRAVLITAMWIQLILAVCYIPQAIVTVFLTQKGLTLPLYTALQYGQTLSFLNSSLNPFFYFWKIGKVRKTVKNIVNQLCCSVTGAPSSLHERGRDSCLCLRAVLCYKRLFTKACMGCKQFFLKERKNVMFVNKIDLSYCLVVFFVGCPRLRPF